MIAGTTGYAEEAEELVKRYESIPFVEKHHMVLHVIPSAPCRVLDIGAGTGADAAYLAAALLAEPEGYLRLFVDEGETLRLLILGFRFWIEQQGHRFPSPFLAYIDKLLAAFAVPKTTLHASAPPVPNPKIQNPKSKIQNPKSKIQRCLTSSEPPDISTMARRA